MHSFCLQNLWGKEYKGNNVKPLVQLGSYLNLLDWYTCHVKPWNQHGSISIWLGYGWSAKTFWDRIWRKEESHAKWLRNIALIFSWMKFNTCCMRPPNTTNMHGSSCCSIHETAKKPFLSVAEAESCLIHEEPTHPHSNYFTWQELKHLKHDSEKIPRIFCDDSAIHAGFASSTLAAYGINIRNGHLW